MGAQFSGVNSLKKNEYLNRLVGDESINENDPFWNQLLSFPNNLTLTKANSKLLDESAALQCQNFHQNNLKTGNYGALIRVFCRMSTETRKMSDNQLMTLQTTNALLLIRCFTKYIIEIENESALLEQINAKSIGSSSSSSDSKAKNQDASNLEILNSAVEATASNLKRSSSTANHQQDASSSSSNASPRRFNQSSRANNHSNRLNQLNSNLNQIIRNDSQDDLNENDSNPDSLVLNTFSNQNQENDTLYELVNCLFDLCIEVPVEQHTYFMHLEALNTLIVLLSVQMYTKVPTYESYIYETFMLKMDRCVSDFIKTLLKNIIQQMPPPQTLTSSQTLALIASGNNANSQRSVFSSMASGLWSVMTLGFGSSSDDPNQSVNSSKSNQQQQQIATYLPNLPSDSNGSSGNNANEIQVDCSSRLLAWQSCHILLILTNHCTNESLYNPYRLALFHFTDTQDTPTNLPNSEPLPWFSIDYTKLFQMFTFTLHTDQYTLLLYMLLHRNQHFKMFILSRLNIDLLIIPILKVIYTAPERNSHHIYMALIILLILSEDDLFNKAIHNIPIKKLTWYTERALSEISLGGLLILVIIRTIQFNMTRMRDKYLHTNCLAALANMSSKFFNLHPYVCQRINSLFNLLAKKRTKIITSINTEPAAKTDSSEQQTDNQQQQQHIGSNGTDLVQDLSIIEELMRMVLEIINSCITNSLHHNSNLIYSLLYNKNLYIQFGSHPTFQDVMQNIETVLTSFSHDIENIEDKSIENLKELIDLGVKQFSRERFRKFPELKFKYVEEDQPEEFFVPYVWSLVYKFSNLYWIDHSVKLFYSASNPQESSSKT